MAEHYKNSEFALVKVVELLCLCSSLVGMTFRQVNPRVIVTAKVMASQAGLKAVDLFRACLPDGADIAGD